MARYSNFMSSGSYTFPAPTKYEVDYEDIDSKQSTRSEAAFLHRDRLRAETHIISVAWRLTPSELEGVAAALRPENFPLTFFDATIGMTRTATMYCAKKHASLLVNADNAAEQYWEYSANIIEV